MHFRDIVAYNITIREYIRNGRIQDARDMFDGMPGRNTVSWNSMIMGYASSSRGSMHLALKLFVIMPDNFKDAFTWSTVISGLARHGRVADSLELFRQSPQNNQVIWASAVSSLQQNELAYEALLIFKKMLSLVTEPAPHSFTSALAASANLSSFFLGQQIYSHVLRRGFDSHIHISNAVISMFLKSGCLNSVKIIFHHMPRRDLFTWNSLIMGLGHHGLGAEAIATFHLMQRHGFQPDAISFLGVLQGCSHSGRVKEGQLYFDSMKRDFNIDPQPEHYVCLVDILARASLLSKAMEVISDMPFNATPVFWRALLNGCRISGELRLGLCIASRMLDLEPDNAGACLMIMDLYKAAGRHAEISSLRDFMKDRVRKELGYSWVEIEGKIHLFTARDETHRESDNIYIILKVLTDEVAVFAD